jgi:hypothetical protein
MKGKNLKIRQKKYINQEKSFFQILLLSNYPFVNKLVEKILNNY